MIILYLVVHFATLVAETDQMLQWHAGPARFHLNVGSCHEADRRLASTHRSQGAFDPLGGNIPFSR